MTATDPRLLDLEVRLRMNMNPLARYCPIQPTPKQVEFLQAREHTVLFGGGVARGASAGLLMSALMYVHFPRYKAVIFRRTKADASKPDGILSTAHDWLKNTDARWNEASSTFTFPSGAKLVFAHLRTKKDAQGHESAQYQFMGFDELQQFPRELYAFVTATRQRKTVGDAIPLRIRAAANPGGIGDKWITRYIIPPEHGGKCTRKSVRYIHGTCRDNPHMFDPEGYLARMKEELSEVEYLQAAEGKWIGGGVGRVFSGYNARHQIEALPPGEYTHVMGADMGWHHPTSITVLAYPHVGASKAAYVLYSAKWEHMLPETFVGKVKELNGIYHFARMVVDTQGGAKQLVEQLKLDHNLPLESAPKGGSKAAYLENLNANFEHDRLFLIAGRTEQLSKELDGLRWLDDTRQKTVGPDHAVDSLLYAFRVSRHMAAETPEENPYEDALEEAYEIGLLQEAQEERELGAWGKLFR